MNILTFDIEEWFHILGHNSIKHEGSWGKYESRIHQNMDRIFQILDDTDSKATFFCLGWVAKNYPDVIKRIHDNGYEIGTHSHLHQLAYEQTPKEFENDLTTSIQAIEDITGEKIKLYRAPGFSLKYSNRWVFDILIKNGIEIDCSVFPAKRSHGGYDRFGNNTPCLVQSNNEFIKEFPISTFSTINQTLIYSGGGYFRFMPYGLIKLLMKRNSYNMAYFHPRDFDAGQLVIEDLSIIRKFKSYYGLGSAEGKLRRLLQEFPFTDIRSANNSIDWKDCNIIKID
jgi:polysaccharide deacetylase family protein (PEP-CTERM system associated)